MAPLFQRLFVGDEEEERPKAAKEDHQEAAPERTTLQESSGKTAQETPILTQSVVRESAEGLIPANKLPPAADALAELFAEAPAGEKTEVVEAAQPKKISEMKAEESATNAAPKRRGIFARLLTFKRAPATTPERQFPTEQDSAGEARAEAAAQPAPDPGAETKTEIGGEPAAKGAQQEIAEPAASEFARVMGTPEAPIPAEALPSAADDFEKLFPSEEASAAAAAEVTAEALEEIPEAVHEEESIEAFSEAPVEALVEVVSNASVESISAEGVPPPTATYESSGVDDRAAFGAETGRDAQVDKTSVETSVRDRQETGRLGSRESEWPYESPYTAPAESPSRVQGNEKHAEILEEDLQTAPAEKPEEIFATDTASLEAPRRLYKDWAFDEKLASHRGMGGIAWAHGPARGSFRAELEASDLISVNLRLADMHDANLRASDLLLADLRDACLVRADLEEACLVGANLEGANLEGASLETAMGLVPRQFAGANLRDALLAPHLMEFEAVTAFGRESKNAFQYFWMMTAASVVSWLLIAKTRDAQLLTDSAIIPFLHSHAAAAALPTAESYLIVPVAIFILYVLFHFHLQRLWDAVVELPAIFPDGHTLGRQRTGDYYRAAANPFPMDESGSIVDAAGGKKLFAGRGVLDCAGDAAAFLGALSDAAGNSRNDFAGAAGDGCDGHGGLRHVESGTPAGTMGVREQVGESSGGQKIKAINPIIRWPPSLGVVLLLLSAGVIFGVPHDRTRAPQYGRRIFEGGRRTHSGGWLTIHMPISRKLQFRGGRRDGMASDEQVAFCRRAAREQCEIPICAGLRGVFCELSSVAGGLSGSVLVRSGSARGRPGPEQHAICGDGPRADESCESRPVESRWGRSSAGGFA